MAKVEVNIRIAVDQEDLQKTIDALWDRAADYAEYCSEMEDEYQYSAADIERGAKILQEILDATGPAFFRQATKGDPS